MNQDELTANAEPAADTVTGADLPVLSGVDPLDRRSGGLVSGGSYLIVGTPGPAKMVAALQFLYAGLLNGERVALVTGADLEGILDASRAWGLPLEDAWRDGRARILGFRDDFELRASRSVAPEEVVEELDRELGSGLDRIAVDPGALFLQGGGKTLLGGAFLRWARNHDSTVTITFSVDDEADHLPASADWLLHATTGRILVERRNSGLYQMTVVHAIPSEGQENAAATVELRPGEGLVEPRSFPAQRGADRGPVDPDRLLLLSLGQASELEAWANATFRTRVVRDPLEAVALVQEDEGWGAIVVSAGRGDIREALRAFRALRPLTRAAVVFASDDALRASDRVQLLEAGADETLTGGLDFRELGLRIRQAVASGSRSPVHQGEWPEAPTGGLLDAAHFARVVQSRTTDPDAAVFSLVSMEHPSSAVETLRTLAAEEIRDEDGDLVTVLDGRLRILLQGARRSQAEPFLERLRARARHVNGSGTLEPEVLSYPGDGERILQLLASAGDDTG